jgi:hypothetical protein
MPSRIGYALIEIKRVEEAGDKHTFWNADQCPLYPRKLALSASAVSVPGIGKDGCRAVSMLLRTADIGGN